MRLLRKVFAREGLQLNEVSEITGLTRQAVQKWESIPEKHLKKLSTKIPIDTLWEMKRKLWENNNNAD